MNVLLLKPGELPTVAEIDGTSKSMKELVGGSIQVVHPFQDAVALVCNENGKVLGLPLNRALRDPITRVPYDIIAGDFFLCAVNPDTYALESLSEEHIKYYKHYFRATEYFLRSSDMP